MPVELVSLIVCCLLSPIPLVTGTRTTSSSRDLLVSRETRGEKGRGGEGNKRDDEDFEFAKTLMLTLTTLSCDHGAVKVSSV